MGLSWTWDREKEALVAHGAQSRKYVVQTTSTGFVAERVEEGKAIAPVSFIVLATAIELCEDYEDLQIKASCKAP